MRIVLFAALLVGLCGCPVNVETVNLDVPTVDSSGDGGMPDAASKDDAVEPSKSRVQRAAVPTEDLAADDGGVDEDVDKPDPRPDFDHDGIPDALDACPVDNPNDTDHDGKCDSQDPCPFDAFDDRDHDGQCDSVDTCPDGDVDSDGDGVCDRLDACPHDAPNDTDSDGQCDSDDRCPLDAHDDSDRDGTCDSTDICPGSNDALDTDHDGVPDGCDKCAGASDGTDADHDGVPNACDTCPAGDDGVDLDANGFADACEQVLWETSAVEQRVEGAPLPFLHPLAMLALETGTMFNGANTPFNVTLRGETSTTTIADAAQITSAERALRNADIHRMRTYFRYQVGPGAIYTNVLLSDVASPRLGENQHVTRIVSYGFAASDGTIGTRWEIRGY